MTIIRDGSGRFAQGFRAILPFWLGAIPLAITFALAAQNAGLTPGETQWMSLTFFSGAVQIASIQFISVGAAPSAIVVTAAALSLHHVLYGLSLAKQIQFRWRERMAAAYFLTDSAFALAVAQGRRLSFAFLFGAELSMFLVWNVATALGVLLGRYIIGTTSIYLDFVGPLAFFILLMLTAKTRLDFEVIMISALGTLICLWAQLGNLTVVVVVVGLGGAVLGTILTANHGPEEKSVDAARSE